MIFLFWSKLPLSSYFIHHWQCTVVMDDRVMIWYIIPGIKCHSTDTLSWPLIVSCCTFFLCLNEFSIRLGTFFPTTIVQRLKCGSRFILIHLIFVQWISQQTYSLMERIIIKRTVKTLLKHVFILTYKLSAILSKHTKLRISAWKLYFTQAIQSIRI